MCTCVFFKNNMEIFMQHLCDVHVCAVLVLLQHLHDVCIMEILMQHLRDVCVDVCVCAVPVLLQHLQDACMYV